MRASAPPLYEWTLAGAAACPGDGGRPAPSQESTHGVTDGVARRDDWLGMASEWRRTREGGELI